MKLHIGIDPGLSGGVAFVPESGTPWAHKMPETDRDLIDLLRDSINLFDARAVIELVHSSPQMGVKSAFTFGEGYGRLQMALTALGVPYERVRPAIWQKAMGCLTKGDKNVSKRRAQELFPTLKVTHAIADALLIGEYARRTHQ
jgi:hypothetical protein